MSNAATAMVYEGEALKQRLRRVERGKKLKALGLVAPLFLFILITFLLPILVLLERSVHDTVIADNLPKTVSALQGWDGQNLPSEEVFAAFVEDMKVAQQEKAVAQIGKRINYEISGVRSKFVATGRKVAELQAPFKESLIALDPVWGDRLTWVVIKRAGEPYTFFYLLEAIDLERNADNEIVSVPENRAIYQNVFERTFTISLIVTFATLILGYPLAYLLANLPLRISNLLMIMVLLPFWTSLLVRTTAWFVLLQDNGIINDALIGIGVTDEPFKLIFSRFGTIIAMTHIQLPFTLLPIYSVMKTIPPAYVRAARSLGAGPIYAFTRIYFPQTLPGIAAGCLLTFILCLGYYITPALVGGPSDQMVSGLIASAMNQESNWSKASALGFLLLCATTVLFLIYNRLVGIDKMKLG